MPHHSPDSSYATAHGKPLLLFNYQSGYLPGVHNDSKSLTNKILAAKEVSLDQVVMAFMKVHIIVFSKVL